MPAFGEWQDGSTAPKSLSYTDGPHAYGIYILGMTGDGVRRVRWWQCLRDDQKSCNFIGDCDSAFAISHWMPLPKEPLRD